MLGDLACAAKHPVCEQAHDLQPCRIPERPHDRRKVQLGCGRARLWTAGGRHDPMIPFRSYFQRIGNKEGVCVTKAVPIPRTGGPKALDRAPEVHCPVESGAITDEMGLAVGCS